MSRFGARQVPRIRFLNQLETQEKNKTFSSFAKIIRGLSEHTFQSSALSLINDFHKFGLTDISIYELSKSSYIILTDDLELTSYLSNKNIDVVNFNNIRPLNWKNA